MPLLRNIYSASTKEGPSHRSKNSLERRKGSRRSGQSMRYDQSIIWNTFPNDRRRDLRCFIDVP